MLLCECPHRDHEDRAASAPPMIRAADHKYRAGIPTLLAFELRELPGKIGAQIAVCGHCSDLKH